jgi:hypothetical protein
MLYNATSKNNESMENISAKYCPYHRSSGILHRITYLSSTYVRLLLLFSECTMCKLREISDGYMIIHKDIYGVLVCENIKQAGLAKILLKCAV